MKKSNSNNKTPLFSYFKRGQAKACTNKYKNYLKCIFRHSKIFIGKPILYARALIKWLDFNVIMALATIIIAIATICYTRYAEKQWEIMQRQLDETRSENRPWIGIKNIDISHEAGSRDFDVEVSVINVGKNPAIIVNSKFYFGNCNITGEPPWQGPEGDKRHQSLMIPEKEKHNGVIATFDDQPDQLAIISAWENQKIMLCLYWQINYRQAGAPLESAPYVTNYCSEVVAGGNYIDCDTYNDAK